MKIRYALLLSLLSGIVTAQQQHIDFGTTAPNDGDDAPTAFTKVENNFTDLYDRTDTLIADISSLTTLVGTKQAADADLTTIAGLVPSNDDVLQRKAGAWINRSLAQLVTDLGITPASLGLQIGTNVQAWDADLDTLAAKAIPAGALVGTTDTQTLTNKSISGSQITSAVANATAAVTATSATTATTANALAANGTNCTAGEYTRGVDASGNAENCTALPTGGDANTNTATSVDNEVALFSGTGGKTLKRATGTGIAKVTSGVLSTATAGTDYYAPGGTDVAVADGGTGSSTASGARTNLGVVIGTDVQAHDTDLDSFAAKTAPSGAVVGTTDTQTLTNKTLTSPSITTPTGIVKGDVGLGNVDNTSDATKNAAVATLTNKSISGAQITSAVATSTALAANGTNCSSGDAAGGVDASGNAEDCFTPSSGAPTSATYITQTASAGLSNEQAMGALATGLVKNTTTTGVQSIAAQGTDYYAPGGTDIAVVDGGTGSSTASGARTNLGVAIGSDVQAWDADLDAWATRTAPSGTVVGDTDTQTLTNKTISGSSNTLTNVATSSLTGTLQAAQFPALTGDVTTSAGSLASTISAGAVTDAKSSLSVKPASTVVATSNQALTGTPTIDSVATADGSIILATAQSTGSENGPWVAHAGAWTRPTWYASGSTTQAFQFITSLVRLGTVYQGTTWRQMVASPITIDTTATTWQVVPYALNASTVSGSLPAANVADLGANPSASVGLSAVNGAATTYMRSDGAPALSQSIAPTWTGNHTWSLAEPRVLFNETDQAADEKLWDLDVQGKTLRIRTRTDADGAGSTVFSAVRGAGTALSSTSVGTSFSASTFIALASSAPSYRYSQTGAGTDATAWWTDVNSGVWKLRTLTDALGTGKDAIAVTRGATTSISNIAFGNATDNPTYTFLGSGALSATAVDATLQTVTTNKVNVTSSVSPPTTGIYRAGASRLGFTSGSSTQAGEFDANQRFVTLSGRIIKNRIVTAAGDITATVADEFIGVNKTSGAATVVNLFTCAAANQGQVITVKDMKADAATNNITVDPNSTESIDGASTYVINTNRGAVTAVCDATSGWQITAVR